MVIANDIPRLRAAIKTTRHVAMNELIIIGIWYTYNRYNHIIVRLLLCRLGQIIFGINEISY